MAEREGFEPSIRFRIYDFQSYPFGLSGTSPCWPEKSLAAKFLKDEGGIISSFPGLDPSASLQGFAPAAQIQFSLSCENCRTLDTFPYIRFRDVPLRPLGHLSVLAELPIQFCHSERSEESRVFEAD